MGLMSSSSERVASAERANTLRLLHSPSPKRLTLVRRENSDTNHCFTSIIQSLRAKAAWTSVQVMQANKPPFSGARVRSWRRGRGTGFGWRLGYESERRGGRHLSNDNGAIAATAFSVSG